MALETLKGVEKIGGFNVVDLEEFKKEFTGDDGKVDWENLDANRKDYPISIAHNINAISFKIQEGPVKEVGINGCQVDTMIETSAIIIQRLNDKFPCDENKQALTHLKMALDALETRKANRIKRGVEGYNEV